MQGCNNAQHLHLTALAGVERGQTTLVPFCSCTSMGSPCRQQLGQSQPVYMDNITKLSDSPMKVELSTQLSNFMVIPLKASLE